MITFTEAKKISEVVHYVIVWAPIFTYAIFHYKRPVSLALKFYALIIIWGIICYACDGCPITLTENWISNKIYGQPFYPNYTFTGSDFHYLITSTDFYIPAILSLVIVLISKRYESSDT